MRANLGKLLFLSLEGAINYWREKARLVFKLTSLTFSLSTIALGGLRAREKGGI